MTVKVHIENVGTFIVSADRVNQLIEYLNSIAPSFMETIGEIGGPSFGNQLLNENE